MSYWLVTFAAVAVAYACLAAVLGLRGSRSWHNHAFIAAIAATALWAAVETAAPAPGIMAAAASLRDGAWFVVLLSLIRSNAPSERLWRKFGYVAASLLVLDLVFGGLQLDFFTDAGLRLNSAVTRMVVSAFGLLLLENLLRNLPRDRVWALKLLGIGLGLVFAFNLVMEIPRLFANVADQSLLLTQPLIYLLVSPFFIVTAVRMPSVALRVHSSRRVVFHSATLLAGGVVLEGMALAALYVRNFGGTSGTALSLVLLFFCAACLTTAAASGSMRSRIRLFINENFFNYKYDYRVEWSRFISTLSAWDEDDVPVRVLRTLADLMDCPGGLLLVHREGWHRFMPLARWSVQGDAAPLAPDDAMLIPFADQKLSYLEIAPLSKDSAVQSWSQRYGFGWLVVPLRYRGELAGIAILSKPRASRKLDWEDRNLISLVAQQLAVYLVHDETSRALADARQLEEFNRRVAFVVHDMKTSIGQLSLLARNAERFGHEVQFRKDMVATIHHSVRQLEELLARLKGKSTKGPQDVQQVNLCALLAEFVDGKTRLGHPVCLRETPFPSAMTEIDQPALLSVLEHVVTNAIEAAPSSPVELSLERVGGSWRISVQDRGVGMAPTFLSDELFRPLRSTKGLGLGIGAYQARETMRDLHGDLEICSKVGMGTTVQLVLPSPEYMT